MIRTLWIVSLCCALYATAGEAPEPAPDRPGVTIEDLPLGRFRSQVERLQPDAKAQALVHLGRISHRAHDCSDLHADEHGGIYFACSSVPPPAPVQPAAGPRTRGISAAAVPIANQPSYHSKPGATNRIFLDFNGALLSGTVWSASTLDCRPFDTDGDETTFIDTEQAIIQQVWQRMAEDFAPFNVDVTTDPTVEGSKDRYTGTVLVTRRTDRNGVVITTVSTTGVAYGGVFGAVNYHTYWSPAFCFFDGLSSKEDWIAEISAHEMGHNLGLSHDGVASPSAAYYYGHTSWGPIMGAAFNCNVSQFSKGDYLNSNQSEDDLSIINTYLGYRSDDHGNVNASATAISGPALSSSGIIAQNSDVDVVSFSAGAGAVSITVASWRSPVDTSGGNLDVRLDLQDATGASIASANPSGAVDATITTTVAAGLYYLHVSNAGEGTPLANPPSGYTTYGSIGQWFLTGTCPPSTTPLPAATIAASDAAAAEPGSNTGTFTITFSSAAATATTVSFTVAGSAASGSDFTSFGTSVTVPASATTATLTVVPLDDAVFEGSETVVVTLASGIGYTVGSPASATVTIADDDPAPVVGVNASDPAAAEPANTGTFTLSCSRPSKLATTVAYSIGGSSTAGSDYTALAGSVVVPALSTSATVTVSPIDDAVYEGAETVVVTLVAGAGYSVGSPATASVTIADDEAAPVASIIASDAAASETNADVGIMTITLSRQAKAATTVAFTLGGTVSPGVDIATLPSSITFPPLSTSALLTVTPIDDAYYEGTETLTVSIGSGSGYSVGSPSTATITLADDEPATAPLTPEVAGGPSCGFGGLGVLLAAASLVFTRTRGGSRCQVRIRTRA
ncbi:MAG: pre-peptidase C-terminal domain-containing protein [Planctomycetes bacterium]|nr:pre-peptidase C-terminal domain-containing protein [Planctomycetota bacterium]